MYKAYKFRIYPDKVQLVLLNKIFGCSRFVYNHYLSLIKEIGYVSAYDNIKNYTSKLKYEYPFLEEVDTAIIRSVIFQLDDNLKKYYHNNFGYPKFKSRFSRHSYTISAICSTYKGKQYYNIELHLVNRKVKLPKLKWIDIRGYRKLSNIQGKIIKSTISKDKNGKYYVSLVYQITPIFNSNFIPKSIVGIDLGIKKLFTLSDGLTV